MLNDLLGDSLRTLGEEDVEQLENEHGEIFRYENELILFSLASCTHATQFLRGKSWGVYTVREDRVPSSHPCIPPAFSITLRVLALLPNVNAQYLPHPLTTFLIH